MPEKSHGQRSLAGYSSWGCKELERTEYVKTGILGKLFLLGPILKTKCELARGKVELLPPHKIRAF